MVIKSLQGKATMNARLVNHPSWALDREFGSPALAVRAQLPASDDAGHPSGDWIFVWLGEVVCSIENA